MKRTSIILTALAAMAHSALAHPGPAGHTHDGTEEWPFPDFSWPTLLIATSLLCIVAGIYSLRKKHESEK